MTARLDATEAQGRITAIAGELVVEAPIDESRLERLRAAAETCRISRALEVPITLRVTGT